LRRAAPLVAAALLLAACTSAPPPPPLGKTTVVGDTSVTVSGSVRVEGHYVD
jgi:hypothetical protein